MITIHSPIRQLLGADYTRNSESPKQKLWTACDLTKDEELDT